MPYIKKTKKRPSVTKRAKIIAAGSAAVAAGLAFGGLYLQQQETIESNAAQASQFTPIPAAPATQPGATVEPVLFAVAGDSITEADSPDINAGKPGMGSWVKYTQSDAASFVGGWAESGSTTAEIASHMPPVDAETLIIVAGTNDVSQSISFEESKTSLRKIVERAGAPSVVVSAIPPFDRNPLAAKDYNAQLESLAASEGWRYIDPLAEVRAGDAYGPGMTDDGVHPTQKAARTIGENMRAALVR